MKSISILGSTGSIGTQTLDVVRNNKDIKVISLTTGSNIELLEKQIEEFSPEIVSVFDEDKAKELRRRVADSKVKILSGREGNIEAAVCDKTDVVVMAVVGMAGIEPSCAAIKAGKNIALANKETLVCAGHIVIPLAKEYGVKILPVDSEHSAIFQSLRGNEMNEISKIILTASGGPFRGKKLSELENISPEEALKHPTWNMGRKVTMDSSTLANKGLEVIEAHWLFNVSYDDIEVVVQPKSIIHSMVEYKDGAVMAQLGAADMKLPIQYALCYPERRILNGERLDFKKLKNIELDEPDMETFKALKLAYRAGREGGNKPAVFNAADEIAVEKFFNREIKFTEIAEYIEDMLNRVRFAENPGVEEILNIKEELK